MKRAHRLTPCLGALLVLGASLAALPQQAGGGKLQRTGGKRLPSHSAEVIGFENLAPGTIVSTVFSNLGTGPIGVQGISPGLGAANAAVVFDSSNPTGTDFDLGTPNETSFGPGIGVGGEFGMPFQNVEPLGNLLIVAEDLVDADGDGLVDDPDDADFSGHEVWRPGSYDPSKSGEYGAWGPDQIGWDDSEDDSYDDPEDNLPEDELHDEADYLEANG